jgi:hypothetical protein
MARSGQGAQIFALVMMVAALVAILVLRGQCSRAVGGYFETLDEPATPARPAVP